MFLLDTNVVSELRKGVRTNPGVRAFFSALKPEEIYLAVQTIGELRRGVESIRGRGDVQQADSLEGWLNDVVASYSGRILDFDLECAQLWGRLLSPNPQNSIDKQIAAIGLIYDLTVATRNTADFGSSGVRLLNPFT